MSGVTGPNSGSDPRVDLQNVNMTSDTAATPAETSNVTQEARAHEMNLENTGVSSFVNFERAQFEPQNTEIPAAGIRAEDGTGEGVSSTVPDSSQSQMSPTESKEAKSAGSTGSMKGSVENLGKRWLSGVGMIWGTKGETVSVKGATKPIVKGMQEAFSGIKAQSKKVAGPQGGLTKSVQKVLRDPLSIGRIAQKAFGKAGSAIIKGAGTILYIGNPSVAKTARRVTDAASKRLSKPNGNDKLNEKITYDDYKIKNPHAQAHKAAVAHFASDAASRAPPRAEGQVSKFSTVTANDVEKSLGEKPADAEKVDNHTIFTTTEPFGEQDEDSNFIFNFSDENFGGTPASAESLALEEILVHSSTQLLAIQNNDGITDKLPEINNEGGGKQRIGGAAAGEGHSHATVLTNVQINVKVDSQKEVLLGVGGEPIKGRDNKNATFYGTNAKIIYDAFKAKALKDGKKEYGPKEFVEDLKAQDILIERPEIKTVVNGVAPSLNPRASIIKELKRTIGGYEKEENQNRAVSNYEIPKAIRDNAEEYGINLLQREENPITVAELVPHLKTYLKKISYPTKPEVRDYIMAADAKIRAQLDVQEGEDKIDTAGWFGAGAFANPGELVALTQFSLAGFYGVKTQVFHNVAPSDMVAKREAQLGTANRLYESEIKPLLKQEGTTKATIIAKIQEIVERDKFPIGDMSTD